MEKMDKISMISRLGSCAFRSLKTFHLVLHQGMFFHSYIGLPVLMTSSLLLGFSSSNLPCLRQHILGITPDISFLGNPVLTLVCG